MAHRCLAFALFAFLLPAAAGCGDPDDGPTPGTDASVDAGTDGPIVPPGDASGTDGSMPGDGTVDTDAGPPPAGALPPDDITDCAIEAVLGFVNDTHTTTLEIVAVDVRDTVALGITGFRPFADATALARVPGMDADTWHALAEAAGGGCALAGGEPELRVRFTAPQCAALPAHGIPAGVRCYGSTDERDASREAAGIVDHVLRWLDSARRVKEAHPERPVRVVMAYLDWSDYRIYDAICDATAAGVVFEGFFDQETPGAQVSRLAADASCNLDNITISFLGGVTTVPDWRLMHVKMMLFETGEPTTRILFGSANLTTTGSTIHFENWVFARFAADSHFALSHRCARDALMADRYDSMGAYPAVFRATYDGCVAGLAATEDPRFRVFFSPDPAQGALNALIAEMSAATTSVDMAIQHFSSWELGRQLRANGMESGVATRLLLDDDTFYDVGDIGGVDRAMYDGLLTGAGIDIRFLQTNYYLPVGWQYQHNKFVIIDDSTVFCGAGNFTGAAFTDNYENFYLIRTPAFATAYVTELDRLLGLAKLAADLPASSMY